MTLSCSRVALVKRSWAGWQWTNGCTWMDELGGMTGGRRWWLWTVDQRRVASVRVAAFGRVRAGDLGSTSSGAFLYLRIGVHRCF